VAEDRTDHKKREIKIFVASAFKDMGDERNYLVKHIFPKLRRLCEERGVVFTHVDLRWGITDKEVSEGEMLPLLIHRINACNCFIGILGDHYGGAHDKIPESLVTLHPWIHSLKDRSVTELEFMHGSIGDSPQAKHAFFYFREPGKAEAPPPDRQSMLGE